MRASNEQQFLPSVQGLRGVAALSVIIVHLYGMPLLAGVLPPDFPAWAHATINTGGHGVELFFVISGYLIPASLVRHAALSKFFYDRAMRIMPMFLVLHLTLFIVGPIVGYKFFLGMDVIGYIRAFLANLLFVPNLVGEPIGQQNAWTLTYEWAFYFWFAAIYVATARHSLPAKVALVLFALACIAVFPIVTYFAIGMALSKWRFRIGWPGPLGVVAGVACIAGMYALCEYVHPYLGLPLAAIAFAMVLHPASGLSQLMETRALQFVGRISYSLYLVHPFVFFPLLAIARRMAGFGLNPWVVWLAFVVVAASAALLASTITYELIEVRFRRWLDGRLKRRHPKPAEIEDGTPYRS